MAEDDKKKVDEKHAERIGIVEGAAQSARIYTETLRWAVDRGHGFAAEKANHLIDKFSGKDTRHVGGDNAKDGADRIVDGINIQSKYCSSGSKCVRECFNDSGQFRYFNKDGSPMQIEVPSDHYESAVQAMQERIKKGEVKGVKNPKYAAKIIRKGHITYKQARQIAKAGTIEGLSYDAANGITLAGCAGSISAIVAFSTALWNGEDKEAALKSAGVTGLKVGGTAWVSSIFTSQLSRSVVEKSLRPATDWVVNKLGSKTATLLTSGLNNGQRLYGASAMSHASKMLRGNIVSASVSTVVMSSADIKRVFDKRISGAQLFKNMSNNAVGIAGGIVGGKAGAVLGTAVFPGVGTAAGAATGFVGGIVVGAVAQKASSSVLDKVITDDAVKMKAILSDVFTELAIDNLLTSIEVERAMDLINEFSPDTLYDMHAAVDKKSFSTKLLEPVIINIIQSRQQIIPPSNDQLLLSARTVVEDMHFEEGNVTQQEGEICATDILLPPIPKPS